MPLRRLTEFLDSHGIKYVRITHSPAYTAQEIAASAHISGKELAKTVMVKIDGQMAMVVLPAPSMIDLDLFRGVVGAKDVELATETEFSGTFPECDLGAMPPFGNLFGLSVYMDRTLSEDEEIAFNAGSHTELIRMAYKDFAALVPHTMVGVTVPAPS